MVEYKVKQKKSMETPARDGFGQPTTTISPLYRSEAVSRMFQLSHDSRV